jgi:hypothetical protein
MQAAIVTVLRDLPSSCGHTPSNDDVGAACTCYPSLHQLLHAHPEQLAEVMCISHQQAQQFLDSFWRRAGH